MNKFHGQSETSIARFTYERYFPEPGIQGILKCGAFDGMLIKECPVEKINTADVTLNQKLTHIDLLVLNADGHESIIDGMGVSSVLPQIICIVLNHISGLSIIRDQLAALDYVYDISANGKAYFIRKDAVGLFALRHAAISPTHNNADMQSIAAAKKSPLAFIHIPKCSGTSFENYLTTSPQFMGRCNCFTGIDPYGKEDDVKTYLERNSLCPFVFGHIPYALYERYIPEALFATFLRDPIQRTISQYKSWHNADNFHSADPHYNAATQEVKDALAFSQKATLEEFIKTDNPYIVANALNNVQTTMLSSYENVSLDVHLASAKNNLTKCTFFGLTEKFEESICIFQSIFLDAPPYGLLHVDENRSPIKLATISRETMRIIREQVAYDIQLYDYAKTLFEARQHPQFSPQETFLLADLCPHYDESSGNKECFLDRENQFLQQQLSQSAASNKELAELYNSMIRSKGWRFIEAIRAAKKRFQKK